MRLPCQLKASFSNKVTHEWISQKILATQVFFFFFFFFQNCTQTDIKHESDGVAKEEIIITAIKFLENMTQHNTLKMIFDSLSEIGKAFWKGQLSWCWMGHGQTRQLTRENATVITYSVGDRSEVTWSTRTEFSKQTVCLEILLTRQAVNFFPL